MLTRRNALAAPAVLAASRPRRRTRPILFGANRLAWDAFRVAVPRAEVTRVYYHGVNRFPAEWPDGAVGARAVVSFEPHPADLLAGRLDSRLLAAAATAPHWSMIVPWYEAGPANPRRYPSWVTARHVQACQRYLHRLLAPTNVRTGSVICGPAADLHTWIAPGLDWYGADIDGDWFLKGGMFEVSRFERRQAANLAVWKQKARSGRPRVVIAETNCGHDRYRAVWFAMLAAWHAEHEGARLVTYWSEPGRVRQGTGTGPWASASDQTTDILRQLSELYRA